MSKRLLDVSVQLGLAPQRWLLPDGGEAGAADLIDVLVDRDTRVPLDRGQGGEILSGETTA